MKELKILPRSCEVPGSNLFSKIGYHKLNLFVALLSTSRQIPDTNPNSITTASFQAIFNAFLINQPLIQQHISLATPDIGK